MGRSTPRCRTDPEQLQRGGRIRPRHVVRDLREVASAGMPASATRISSMEIAADGTRSSPSVRIHAAGQDRRPGGGADDRDGAGVRHGGGDRAEADPFGDVQTLDELDDRVRQLTPAVVGLRPAEQQQVAAFDRRVPDGQLGPGQLGQPAVADLQRRPPGAVVEQRVGIELGHDRAAVTERLDRRRRGLAGVHPRIERDDDRRGDDLDRFDQPIQRHGKSIRLRAGAARRRRPGYDPPMVSIETSDALGAVAATWGVLMAVSPLLQIRRMLERRSSADVSIAYLSVLQIGFGLWIAYGIALGSVPLIVPNCVAMMVGFVTIAIAWAYRNGRPAVTGA